MVRRRKTITVDPPRKRLLERSTGDIIVLMIAFTVCTVVLITTIAIIGIKFFKPEVNTDIAVRTVSGLTNTLIGLLAGFIAGRSTILREDRVKQKDNDETIEP
jgi:predicted permease